MQKRISVVCFAVVAVALLGLAVCFFPAEAQALDLEEYDHFDSEFIDPVLWAVSSENLNRQCNLEMVKKIDIGKKGKGELQLAVRGYPLVGVGEVGQEDTTAIGVRFINPDPNGHRKTEDVRTIEAEVKITDFEFAFTQFPSWGPSANANLEILGSFFSLVPCDQPIDEVGAGISIKPVTAPEGPDFDFEVFAGIGGTGTELDVPVLLGYMNTDERVTFRLQFDQTNQKFTFQMDEHVEEIYYGDWLQSIGKSEMRPCTNFRDFRVKLWLPNLPEGAVGSDYIASMEVLIDDVRIESEPWPEMSTE
jgi:hypothetical protein